MPSALRGLVFWALEYIPWSGIAESYGNSVSLFEVLPNYFPKHPHRFTVPPAMDRISVSSTSSPALLWVVLNYSPPTWREVISHYDFNSHFHND